MRWAPWLLLALPLAAGAQGGKREKVEAIAELEARRADERARARPIDEITSPLELRFLEALERELGLELIVEPVSRDRTLERQRRLEALRVEVFARLARLGPESFAGLADDLAAAERAYQHRLVRVELDGALRAERLARLVRALEDDPSLRAMLFLHGHATSGARRAAAVRRHLEGRPAVREGRLVVDRSGEPRPGATLYLARLAPTPGPGEAR